MMPRDDSPQDSSPMWVDPARLPEYGDVSTIRGNASPRIKQLTYNTLGGYGVGKPGSFAYSVGRELHLTEVDIYERDGKREATTEAEVLVSEDMLNGAGRMHGGCICYIIDNCASTPLVVLGLARHTNGVGVTQMMNVCFHSPASLGSKLRIVSVAIVLGRRVMTARCEITEIVSGKVVASALLSKMQPITGRL